MKSSMLRRLIESENARNMSRQELVDTFIPTDSFIRLLTHTNHVIKGSRGSGKTALAKMLSHDHLAELALRGYEPAAEAFEKRSFVGVYVSTKAEWVGSLRNKVWKDVREKEQFFVWRLNLASCGALLRTLRSCLNSYVSDEYQRLSLEYAISGELSGAWFRDNGPLRSIVELRRRLEDTEYDRHYQLTYERVAGHRREGENPIGLAFSTDLFSPLKRGITLIKRHLEFPERSKWAICLDEAEFLDIDHHRILNSHMRSDSEDLTFKITTTPYRHLTLETNTGAPLRVNHDFEYVYIDQERKTYEQEEEFAERLFQKTLARLGDEYKDLTLSNLLGESVLLESKSSTWMRESEEVELLKEHATPELWQRAVRLSDSDTERFRNEIVRKIHGLLKLREAVRRDKGHRNLSVYSGAKMLTRCSDGNPRRLLQLISAMLRDLEADESDLPSLFIPPEKQTRTLIYFSSDALTRTKSEPGCGEDLYKFLRRLGEYMHHDLHNGRMSSDVITAFEVDTSLTDKEWRLIESAVEIGLLFPYVTRNNPDSLPIKEGRFHLANVLAPLFRLLPRRGKERSLTTMLTSPLPQFGTTSHEQHQFSLWDSADE